MERVEKVKQIVRKTLENSSTQSLAHKWDHIDRVCRTALKIAEKYSDVNTEILHLAALLHDIGQPFNNKKEHARLSAEKAAKILADVGYSDGVIENVCKIILEHSSENELERNKFSCIESKILFDADKINGIGALGIARAFLMFGHLEKDMEECLEWYRKNVEEFFREYQKEMVLTTLND